MSKRIQGFRFGLSCKRELGRYGSIISFLAFVAVAAAQNGGGNTETNPVPAQMVLTNPGPLVITNTFAAQTNNELTNLLDVAPVPLPLLAPRAVGGDQLAPPLLGTGVFAPPAGAVARNGVGVPIWGPIDLHPSLSYAFTYGTGIESTPGQQQNTAVSTISPAFLFDLGTKWKLDYSPSYTIYSDPAFRNTWSHALSLSGGTTYEDWAFNLSQTYSFSDEPLIETGTQTSQEAYGTSIGAAYQMGSHLSLSMSANQSLRYAAQFDNVESWTGNAGLNYQFIPQFGMGISLSGGYNDLSAGSSMPFEGIQGTLNFHPGKRLSLSLSGGAQETQFVHPSAPSLISPTFSASLAYQLFTGTSLSLTGSRSVNPSYFANQVQTTTSVAAGLNQKISRKISLSMNAGYTTEPLTTIVPGPLPKYFIGAPPNTSLTEDQNNSTTSLTVSLSYAIIPNAAMSVYYTKSDNSSSQANFGYSSSQIGLTLSYSY